MLAEEVSFPIGPFHNSIKTSIQYSLHIHPSKYVALQLRQVFNFHVIDFTASTVLSLEINARFIIFFRLILMHIKYAAVPMKN